ncbi:hypothetical protein ACPA9J_23970 [Pseudomonas aeruginosa]
MDPREAQLHQGGRPGERPAEAGNGHRRRGNDPTLAPETNGQVAVKAWKALSEITGREHAHCAEQRRREDPLPRYSRRSRGRLSPARPGLARKMNMSP